MFDLTVLATYLCVPGDNLLTAVSVSRKCEMVPASSMVIEVKVTVVGNAGPPSVTYQLIGERAPTGMCMYCLNMFKKNAYNIA